MESSDRELWEKFTRGANEDAFAELVKRHLPLVHGVAFRVTGNRSLAEEVSQLVFSKLAHGRRAIPESLPLAAWLHRTTRVMAIGVVRSEIRRAKREKAAAAACTMNETSKWEDISPLLDEVIDRLSSRDRSLIISRYFEGQSHSSIGRLLGVSEDGARMGVNRALEKLRGLLAKRGVTTTANGLGVALLANGAPEVSAGLCSTVHAAALAGGTTFSVPMVTFGIFTMSTKIATISGCVIVLAVAGLWVSDLPGEAAGFRTSSSNDGVSATKPVREVETWVSGHSRQARSKARSHSGNARESDRVLLMENESAKDLRQARVLEYTGVLKTRLGLSNEQERSMVKLMNASFEDGGPLDPVSSRTIHTLFDGEGGPELVTRNTETKIASLFDPAQKKEFDVFLEEQRENRVESKVNREMQGILGKLTLTQDQKARLYSALGEQAGVTDRNPDREAVTAAQERLLVDLGTILTPEQLETYRTMPRPKPSRFLPPHPGESTPLEGE